ncbi:MAG: right-handed parallel beta-helix repeat-containing protein [Deltaproteobacteria bacterium]|nr:right-handed parallel beta-helix repeat-containing protein [Deltaproteobacteria bacterium]
MVSRSHSLLDGHRRRIVIRLPRIFASAYAAIVLCVSVPALAATFYVTQDGSGNHDGSNLQNAMSVTEHNAASFSPGDTIFLHGQFTTKLQVPSSGSEAAPITYDGNEAGNGVGDALFTFSERYGPMSIRVEDQSYLVFQDIEVTGGETGMSLWGDVHHVTIKRMAFHDILVRGIGIHGDPNASDITIGGSSTDGCELYDIGAGTAGGDIIFSGTQDTTISYNHMYGTPEKAQGTPTDRGIDGIVAFSSSNIVIEYNTIHSHNDSYNPDGPYQCGTGNACEGEGEDGIDLKESGNHDFVIRYNHIYDFQHQTGITVQRGTSHVQIYGNAIHDCRWAGILVYQGSTGEGPYPSVQDVRIFANVIYHNQGPGISVTGQDWPPKGISITNNVIAENATTPVQSSRAGIYVVAGSGHRVVNNIFYMNRPNEQDHLQVRIGGGAEADVILDNNLYFWPGATSKTMWGDPSTTYDSIQVPGHEQNGLETPPLFMDATGFDYRLQDGSPAVDSAQNLGENFNLALAPTLTDFSSMPPSAATVNQAYYGTGWEIGAYVHGPTNLKNCTDMGGACCTAAQTCEDGSFEMSLDCDVQCCVGGTCTDRPDPKEYLVKRASQPPPIDGLLGEYDGAPEIRFTIPDTNTEGMFRLLWDDTALYIAVQVSDDDLNADVMQHDGALWSDDAMEIMFDTLNDLGATQESNDYKIIVNVFGTQGDWRALTQDDWEPTYTSAVLTDGTINDGARNDHGYTIEVAIPWSEWGIAVPSNGDVWGMDMALDDKDASGVSQTAWNNSDKGSINDPDGWGRMTFSNEEVDTSGGCSDGQTNCDGICADLNQDPNHCGSCTNACDQGQVCTDGQCVPQGGGSGSGGCGCDTGGPTGSLPLGILFIFLFVGLAMMKRRTRT